MKIPNVVGITIFAIGVLLLAGYGSFKLLIELWKDPDVPALVIFGVLALILGLVIVLITLFFERLKDKKKEKDL